MAAKQYHLHDYDNSLTCPCGFRVPDALRVRIAQVERERLEHDLAQFGKGEASDVVTERFGRHSAIVHVRHDKGFQNRNCETCQKPIESDLAHSKLSSGRMHYRHVECAARVGLIPTYAQTEEETH